MISVEQAAEIGRQLGVDFARVDFEQFRRGIEVELEHTPVLQEAGRIALDHLNERADYYSRLQLAEGDGTFSPAQGKAQWIRLADVFVIGPLMVAGGMALTRRSPFWGILLGAFGIGTIVFNGRNWYIVNQLQRGERPQAGA